MSTYVVEVFRDDEGFILIRVPELDLLSQARNVAAAERSARDLVAVWLDVDPAGVAVSMDYSRLAPEAMALVEQAQEQTHAAAAATEKAAASWRTAARHLVENGRLSRRDAAAVLGVTAGRVQQLVGGNKGDAGVPGPRGEHDVAATERATPGE